MKLEISYPEIIHYVKNNYDRDISIETESPNMVRIGTDVILSFAFLNITKHIEVEITLDKLSGSDLYIDYIIMYLTKIEENFAHRYIDKKLNGINANTLICENNGKNKLVVHLGNIQGANDFLKKINIKDISFNNDRVVAELNMK